ncbi:MAG: serine/threonine protein kinase [Verrucomicrobiaceae bacterium]|nr:serine/threonine protein kinase [Verrucomicrobiaceae bacterium]
MNIPNSCPQCGAKLPADAPEALCPACLMSKALPSNFDTVKLDAPPWSKGASVRYVGDYELLEEVAKGGMGVVWKARQTKLDRLVAVKMIRGGALAGEEEVRRFHAEAQAAANLRHPNIVSIHEVGEHEGQHYYSMDFIEGTTLADVCHGKAMNARAAAELLRVVCDAVHFAHQRGVLHRDLKPHNLMLDASGQPHVLDFGLAKRLDDDQALTMSGAVLGSPSYMAPEQAQGRHDLIGTHTDVYALGAILYQMLTGRPPFLASSAAETMMQVVQREPSAPSRFNADIPRALETICLKCLEKEPARRYATARELGEELARFLKGEPILAQPASFMRKTATWLRQHPGWLASAAALLVFGLLCAVFYLYQENAFMRAQQLDPSLKREPGVRSRGLISWFGLLALIVMNLGMWTNMWFLKHARRATMSGLFDQSRFKPTYPVPSHVRWITALVGLVCIGFGLFVIARIIEAHVWEGSIDLPGRPRTAPSGYLFGAFCIVWIGIMMQITVWLNRQRSLRGAPARRLDETTQAAIRAAVTSGDVMEAMRLYRHAVPDADIFEAREHINTCVDELRQKDLVKFQQSYENPARAFSIRPRALIGVLVAAVAAFLVLKPAAPLLWAWYVLGGALFAVLAHVSMHLRGFLLRVLLFIACSTVVFTGGNMLFEKDLPGHIWLMMAGIVAAVLVVRPGVQAQSK